MIIAVAAVIAMTEIGQGAKSAIQKRIASMGANTLMIQSGAASTGGVSFGAGTSMTLTPQDADEIARQCPAVASVSPWSAPAQIVYGNRNWVPTFINGVAPIYLKVQEWEDFDEGGMFSDTDVRNSTKVCVVGTTIRRELFQDESPIGKELRMRGIAFKVVGVLSSKGANMMGMDQDDIVMAPWTTIKYRLSGTTFTNTNQSAAAAAAASGRQFVGQPLSTLPRRPSTPRSRPPRWPIRRSRSALRTWTTSPSRRPPRKRFRRLSRRSRNCCTSGTALRRARPTISTSAT